MKVSGGSVWLAMDLNINAKGRSSLQFFNPLGLQSQSVEMVVVAEMVDGHDGDVTVVRLDEVSGNRFVSHVFGISTVFQETGFKGTFCFSNILLTTFFAADEK